MFTLLFLSASLSARISAPGDLFGWQLNILQCVDGVSRVCSAAVMAGIVLTVPITETPNELTVDIDMATPEGIVRILRQTDAQVFTGWRDLPGNRPLQSLLPVWRWC